MKNETVNTIGKWIAVGVLLLFIAGCRGVAKEGTTVFMVGRFERPVNTEFSKGNVALVITQQQGDVYLIERYAATTRVRKGTELPVRYDTTRWTGIYRPTEQVIYVQKGGKVISFEPRENKLRVGGMEYVKINQ